MLKILLDANIFVSALINPNGPPAQIIDAWLKSKFCAVISIPLLKEVAEVLDAPRIKSKYGLSDDEITKFLRLISERGSWVIPSGKFKICRHSNDNLILETAIIGKVKYLVSRDDDIKRDKTVIVELESRGVTILSVRLFLDKLNKNNL